LLDVNLDNILLILINTSSFMAMNHIHDNIDKYQRNIAYYLNFCILDIERFNSIYNQFKSRLKSLNT